MITIRRKMRMRALLAAGAAGAMFALPVWADEKRNAAEDKLEKPAYVDQDTETTFRKVGEARLKVFFWSIYDSRLYTPSGSYVEGERPLRLDIEYLRNIKASDLVKRTHSEWKAMGREHPRQSEWLAQLGALLPDIRSNDVLSMELHPDNAASFRFNGELLGRIEDRDFGQQFADIWLSGDCTRPELRLALLGQA
ncbi:MAG: hypothetical protein ACI87W_002642 [Halieaceae bacterium]|jgi:hypothetical protein